MYRVLLSRSAVKDLDKVNKKYKPHIFAVLFDLRKDPYLGKKLKGKFHDCYSSRVGLYRIIYSIYKRELKVLIIRIAHRGKTYK